MSSSFSFLCADVEMNDFITGCATLGITLEKQRETNDIEDLMLDIGDVGDADIIGITEHDRKTYVIAIDAELTYSADFVIALSKELDACVAHGNTESVSGLYAFCAARNGEIMRLYSVSYMFFSTPFEKGAPLLSEATVPLDAKDGKGILLALTSCGFEAEEALKSDTFRVVGYNKDAVKKIPGGYDEQIDKHYQSAPDDYKPDFGIDINPE